MKQNQCKIKIIPDKKLGYKILATNCKQELKFINKLPDSKRDYIQRRLESE